MRDPHTKDSRGFAFVTMESSEEADAAIVGLNATELMGRTMNVEKARRGRARTRAFLSVVAP
jgi:transformer-2 protein